MGRRNWFACEQYILRGDGKNDLGGCVWRNRYVVVHALLFDVPIRSNQAVRRVKPGRNARDTGRELWAQPEVFVTRVRLIELEPRGAVIKPGTDRAERVMIEGIHRGVLK